MPPKKVCISVVIFLILTAFLTLLWIFLATGEKGQKLKSEEYTTQKPDIYPTVNSKDYTPQQQEIYATVKSKEYTTQNTYFTKSEENTTQKQDIYTTVKSEEYTPQIQENYCTEYFERLRQNNYTVTGKKCEITSEIVITDYYNILIENSSISIFILDAAFELDLLVPLGSLNDTLESVEIHTKTINPSDLKTGIDYLHHLGVAKIKKFWNLFATKTSQLKQNAFGEYSIDINTHGPEVVVLSGKQKSNNKLLNDYFVKLGDNLNIALIIGEGGPLHLSDQFFKNKINLHEMTFKSLQMEDIRPEMFEDLKRLEILRFINVTALTETFQRFVTLQEFIYAPNDNILLFACKHKENNSIVCKKLIHEYVKILDKCRWTNNSYIIDASVDFKLHFNCTGAGLEKLPDFSDFPHEIFTVQFERNRLQNEPITSEFDNHNKLITLKVNPDLTLKGMNNTTIS